FASPEISRVIDSRIGADSSTAIRRASSRRPGLRDGVSLHCRASTPVGAAGRPVGRPRRTATCRPFPGAMSTDAPQAAPSALDAVRRGEILADVAALRDSFGAGTTRSREARIGQLDALAAGLRAEGPRLLKALELD